MVINIATLDFQRGDEPGVKVSYVRDGKKISYIVPDAVGDILESLAAEVVKLRESNESVRGLLNILAI